MSNVEFAAGMLAWRQAFFSRHPDTAAAVQAELDNWLQLQRNEAPDVTRPLLIVVARLSCLEDVKAQVGLAQMLAFSGVRCAVVLEFPCLAAASIARGQARQMGWQGLLQITDQANCEEMIARLPEDTPLLVFPTPAMLGSDLIWNQLSQRHFSELATPLDPKDAADQTAFSGKAFLGRARDYVSWQGEQAVPDWAALVEGLNDLLSDEVDLGISISPQAPTKRKAWPVPTRPIAGLAVRHHHALSIPDVGIGDELIIRTAREPFHSTVIERRPTRCLSGGDPLSVRLPTSMLGPAPHMVRVETHTADGEVLGDKALVHVRPSKLEPWMISCFLNRGGGGNPAIRALAAAIGARLAYAEDEPNLLQHIPIVWGVLRDSDRILAQAKAQALYYFYIDHAYFDRGHQRSYRITRNGYEAGPIRRCSRDRFDELGVEVRPWRKSGKHIIVCPPTDFFMEAHNCQDWLETTLATLKSVTDRPIVVRAKPKDGQAGVSLGTALGSAHALVTHSSNVAIEAVCLGTPVFVAPASAAAPVGRTELSQIEDPVYPDRDAWLAHLAYNQYSFEEIRDGRAWNMLLEFEERQFAE